MFATHTHCANCKAPHKDGLMGINAPLAEKETKLINEFQSSKAKEYCTKCGNDLLNQSKAAAQSEIEKLTDQIAHKLEAIPVVTTHSPLKWDYDIIGMVTGQSTTGTGVISEFTSTFSDLFGLQADRYNKKLKDGEDLCFAQLRLQAVNAGGNAVIATDIDYTEVGGGKGMLMVCMSGTAIKLNNYEILGESKVVLIKDIHFLCNRRAYLNSLVAAA